MRIGNSVWSALGLVAAAGMAPALAAGPVGDSPTTLHQRLPAIQPADDSASLEMAAKLGLIERGPADYRGLGVCPNIISDGGNCHTATLTLGANFSGAAPGSFRTMDNVTPSSNNPTRICWIGRYADRVDPVANESFRITIFNDVGGLPDLASGPVFTRDFSIGGSCSADWNADGQVNSNDISAFLATWLADLANGTTNADFDNSGQTNSNDISAFLGAWLNQLGGNCAAQPGVNQLEMSCLDGDACPGTPSPASGGHWVYSANVTAGFPMNANACYWIEIANVGSNAAGVNWGWCGSTGGTDVTSLQAIDGAYTTFTRAANDRAICVSGGVNPFLGNCTIPPPPAICENDEANGIPMNGGLTNGFRAVAPGSSTSCGSLFQRAENFEFATQTTVSNVCFGGFWLSYNGTCTQSGFVAPEMPAFHINYYADVNGFPGPAPIATFITGQPGVSYIWDGDEVVSVTHPPITFDANTCYYISIGTLESSPVPGQTSHSWVWFLTFSQTPTGDNWVYSTLSTDPNGWTRFNISSPTQGGNMWFLFNAGPTTLPVCEPPPCLPQEIPANNLCVNAIPLAVPSTTMGTTICADEETVPDCIGTASSAGQVWYTVTGTGGVMTASACNSPAPYDGQMSVFSGTCGGLVCVAGGDDTCPGGAGVPATVSWQSTAGVQYFIMVHGWGGATGAFQLDVSSQ